MYKSQCRVWNSTVASQPCPVGRLTADKKLRYALPKLSRQLLLILWNPLRKSVNYRRINLLRKSADLFAERYTPFRLRKGGFEKC